MGPDPRCKERVDYLISGLSHSGAKIVIPAPVLAEVLVKAGRAGPEWLKLIGENRHFRVVPFDERAAVEFAARQGERKTKGKAPGETRAKAKFDDQIVSIARVEGASIIYSSDAGLARVAEPDIEVVGIAGLPLPPEDRQMSLSLDKRPVVGSAEDPFS